MISINEYNFCLAFEQADDGKSRKNWEEKNALNGWSAEKKLNKSEIQEAVGGNGDKLLRRRLVCVQLISDIISD